MIDLAKKTFTLNNQVQMPSIGLGVLFAKNNGEVEKAIISAVKSHYRKIDTAAAYQNEQGVGKCIKESGIQREALFLTTKVWNTDQVMIKRFMLLRSV